MTDHLEFLSAILSTFQIFQHMIDLFSADILTCEMKSTGVINYINAGVPPFRCSSSNGAIIMVINSTCAFPAVMHHDVKHDKGLDAQMLKRQNLNFYPFCLLASTRIAK